MIAQLSKQNDESKVHCCFNNCKIEDTIKGDYYIYKLHKLTKKTQSSRFRSDKTWIFTTLFHNDTESINIQNQEILSNGFYLNDIKYVQQYQNLMIKKSELIYDYVKIFNMDTNTINDIYLYFKYWDILRECCGSQMSSNWRDKLQNSNKTIGEKQQLNGWKNKLENESEVFGCEKYDIDAITRIFLNTNIAKLMDLDDNLRKHLRPSDHDGPLTPTYCSDYNKEVTKCNLNFNEINCNQHTEPKINNYTKLNSNKYKKRSLSDTIIYYISKYKF